MRATILPSKIGVVPEANMSSTQPFFIFQNISSKNCPFVGAKGNLRDLTEPWFFLDSLIDSVKVCPRNFGDVTTLDIEVEVASIEISNKVDGNVKNDSSFDRSGSRD